LKKIKYYNNLLPDKEIIIPKAYILQKGWHKIIDRLKNNHIAFSRFKRDTSIAVEINYIKSYKTRKTAYEGHYLHYNIEISKSTKEVTSRNGDLYIPTNQNVVHYILET
jgi:hypothetical protein